VRPRDNATRRHKKIPSRCPAPSELLVAHWYASH
jgi:hypothetical protein